MPLRVLAVVDAAGFLVGDLEGERPPIFLLLGLLLEPILFLWPAAIYELLIPAALVVGELPVLPYALSSIFLFYSYTKSTAC